MIVDVCCSKLQTLCEVVARCRQYWKLRHQYISNARRKLRGFGWGSGSEGVGIGKRAESSALMSLNVINHGWIAVECGWCVLLKFAPQSNGRNSVCPCHSKKSSVPTYPKSHLLGLCRNTLTDRDWDTDMNTMNLLSITCRTLSCSIGIEGSHRSLSSEFSLFIDQRQGDDIYIWWIMMAFMDVQTVIRSSSANCRTLCICVVWLPYNKSYVTTYDNLCVLLRFSTVVQATDAEIRTRSLQRALRV
jgi:hypothetical protein